MKFSVDKFLSEVNKVLESGQRRIYPCFVKLRVWPDRPSLENDRWNLQSTTIVVLSRRGALRAVRTTMCDAREWIG